MVSESVFAIDLLGFLARSGKQPLPFALGEFVDNSIAAVRANVEENLEKVIRVCFVEDSSEGSSRKDVWFFHD